MRFLWSNAGMEEDMYLLNKPGLDLREVTINSFVQEAPPGHLPEVGSVLPLLIEKIRRYDVTNIDAFSSDLLSYFSLIQSYPLVEAITMKCGTA